jgi:uncharacterized protein (DUF58 family)
VPSLLKSLRFEKDAWLRFFAAIGGLTLAFASAIFSTVTKQAGNIIATALFASAALLLAGLVALTTVPYLARRVAFERVREVFDYDVTREGLIYLAIVLVLGVAALNTGNNLLFIVVAAMLAAVLVSGIASALVLRGLELQVGLPEHVFAGDSVLARIGLRNTRRFLSSFSVSVVPPRPGKAVRRLRWQKTTFTWPPKASPDKQWLRLPDRSVRLVSESAPADGIFTGRVYFPFIPARASVARDVELSFPRRGRYVQESFGLSTRFPFSFLAKTRRVTLASDSRHRGPSLAREIIVYPSVQPPDELFDILPMITGEFETFVRGRGHDLYRIREYLPEDSARHVDWKASARTGALKVREFTREDERKLRLVFDNPAAGAVPARTYERAVSLAASLAWHFAAENTDLSFAAPDYPGSPELYDFLHYLAMVGPRPASDGAASVVDDLPLTDDYNVILTARSRGTVPTPLWACSYFIFFAE